MKKALNGVIMFVIFTGGLFAVTYVMYKMMAPLITDDAHPLICKTITWVNDIPHVLCVGKSLSGQQMLYTYSSQEAYDRLLTLSNQFPERVQFTPQPR